MRALCITGRQIGDDVYVAGSTYTLTEARFARYASLNGVEHFEAVETAGDDVFDANDVVFSSVEPQDGPGAVEVVITDWSKVRTPKLKLYLESQGHYFGAGYVKRAELLRLLEFDPA
jgi:hypothetical protein